MSVTTILLLLSSAGIVLGQGEGQGSSVSGLFNCPEPWVEYSDNCYYFIKPTHLHADARLACEVYGATLVSVNDIAENDFIVTQLLSIGETNYGWYTSGRRDINDPGSSFKWEDGSVIDTDVGAYGWLSEDHKVNRKGDFIYYEFDNFLGRWGWVRGVDAARSYICETSRANAERIVMVIRGPDYGLNIADETKVPRGPRFTVLPKDVFFNKKTTSNRKVQLACAADGWPQPTYTWERTKSGVTEVLNPQNDDRYTVSNGYLTINMPISDKDFGQYVCKASNKYGTIISHKVQVTFGELPAFPSDERDTQTVNSYTYATIACNPPPSSNIDKTYQWYKDRPDNFVRSDNKPYIFISQGGTLYFSSITTSDSGNYYCLVTTPYGEAESSTKNPVRVVSQNFQVVEPVIYDGFPMISPSAPKRGDNVRVECFAYGTGILEYTWTRVDGNAFPHKAYTEDFQRVLVIPDISLRDAGKYRCTVKRQSGATVFKDISVNPQAIPFFTFPLENKFVDVGADVEWKCRAEGKPDVTYQWYKNGQSFSASTIPANMLNRISWSAARDILSIKTVEADYDDGMYQCAATNFHGSNYTSAELRVLEFKPNFNKKPMIRELLGTEGGNVTLPCQPEAAPKGQRTWRKNGQAISVSNSISARVRLLLDGSLYISNLQRTADRGEYTCVVKNRLGQAQNTTKLMIFSKTSLSEPPITIYATIGEDVSKTKRNFTCVANYNPRLDEVYIWELNGNLIDFRRNGHKFYQGSGNNAGVLYFRYIGYDMAGKYRCIARTVADETSREAELILLGPPGPPAGVDCNVISASSASLTWNEGETMYQAPTTGFRVEARIEIVGKWEVNSDLLARDAEIPGNLDNNQKRATVGGLNAYSTYTFRVRAANKYGVGPPSQSSPKCTTGETAPRVAPRNVTGGSGKVGDLVMQWDALTRAEYHGRDVQYIVYWRLPGQTDSDWSSATVKLPENLKRGRYVKTVGALKFYSDYEIAVRAKNIVGNGPLSAVVTVKSSEEMPTAIPDGVKAEPYNSTALRVFWNPIPDTREAMKGKLRGYLISYWTLKELEDRAERATIWGQASEGIIIGLLPDTYYRVTVNVINGAGNGDKSESYLQRTLKSAPINMPEELTLMRVDSSTIKLKWRGVTTGQNEEPLQGYKVRIWKQGETIHKARDIDAGRRTSIEIMGIPHDPYNIWNLRVFGYSRGGVGKMSSPVMQFIMGCNVQEDNPDAQYYYLCDDNVLTAGSPSSSSSWTILSITLLVHFLYKL